MNKEIPPLYILKAHKGTVVSIKQPLPDSDFILTLSNDKFVLLWNISLGNLINEICNDAAPTKLFVFPKLGFLLIPKWNNSFSLIDLSIFNLSTKHIIDIYFPENEINFTGHKSWILSAIELQEEDKFITCGRDHTLRVWNILSTNCELILDEHKENVNDVIELIEGIIASCSSDGFIKVWNLNYDLDDNEIFDKYNNYEKNKSKLSIYDGELPVFQIEKLKDNCLVSRNESPKLKIWNYITGKLTQILDDHNTNIISHVNCFIGFNSGSNVSLSNSSRKSPKKLEKLIGILKSIFPIPNFSLHSSHKCISFLFPLIICVYLTFASCFPQFSHNIIISSFF